ncbi:MAG TPA: hypothetical protein VHE55_00285 [Fimbriimonadaceae bacterium]|nr:hypothetical protein [Fimbriimonadaceae bacterium]
MEPKRDIDDFDLDEPGVALTLPSRAGAQEEAKSRLRSLRAGFPAIGPHPIPIARARGRNQVQKVRPESRRPLRFPAWRSTKYARFDR